MVATVARQVSVNVAGIATSASAAVRPIGSRPATSVSWSPVTVAGTPVAGVETGAVR